MRVRALSTGSGMLFRGSPQLLPVNSKTVFSDRLRPLFRTFYLRNSVLRSHRMHNPSCRVNVQYVRILCSPEFLRFSTFKHLLWKYSATTVYVAHKPTKS